MSSHRVRLQGREEIAEGTLAFHFEKPVGFEFKAGQAVDVVLGDAAAADAAASRHTFSIVSAPFEHELVIATRMRDSPFKRALRALPLGAPVGLDGPFGSLTLHRNRERAAVFIAGGIGITPFVGMARQAAREQSPQRLLLLYANRRPKLAAFLTELLQLEKRNQNFRVVATMTETSQPARGWDGETRPLDEQLIAASVAGLSRPIYYLAGPPGMVEAARKALNRAGVDDEDVRGEEFYGY